MNHNKKMLIVGLGLIGGSYAKGLMQKGYHIEAIDLNQEDIDYAIENKIIVDGTTLVTKEYVSQFDVVIFALYPKTLLQWLEKYHTFLKNGAIISDVSGVKSSIIYTIQDILRGDNVEFVGAHPMAGKEVSGVKNADSNIFKNANFIITPTDVNTEKAIEMLKDIASDLNFANISLLSPEKHDEMIAFLSQLTHCIAISLMTCQDSPKLKDYTGDSFRDLTRIANINENMWSELFLLNKEQLLKQMDLFSKEFDKLRQAILNDDVKTMKDMMKLSTYRRSFFNKK